MLINESNIEQIIETIRKVHQTSIDQRSVDLNEYLIEFFQSIPTEQSYVFICLTRLLQIYDDRAALKIEFLKSQCFDNLLKHFNTNDENNFVSIFEFLIELLTHSNTVQEKLLEFNGYKTFFSSLRFIRNPSRTFLNRLLFLLIEKPTFVNDDYDIPPLDSFVILINPFLTRSLIEWLPYLADPSDQEYIINSIEKILLRSIENKMMACSNGILLSLLKIFDREQYSNEFNEQVQDQIFSLVEKLVQFSIQSDEIRFICQLFTRNQTIKNSLLQLLIIAAQHRDSDIQSISAYFDLQRSNSGIHLPIIRRWPSISSSSNSPNHFTFHCWLRLNHDVHSYPYEGRRQIYSFYAETFGFEAFIRNSSIFVLVSDHDEIVYMELNDCDDLIDGIWHSLTIVHTAQRSSLFASTLTCYLTIYIDGLLRKEVKDFKYVSLINDPLLLSSIGSPSQRPKESILKMKNDSFSTTIAKTIQPFKGLFSSKNKHSTTRKDNQTFYSQHIMIIEPNTQDTIFGQSISLYGQLSSIWILTETLDSTHVKHLHSLGADFCYQKSSTTDENLLSTIIFDYLSTRSLLIYHPSACNGQTCADISNCFFPVNSRLINVSCYRIHSFYESLLKLGICPVLYPIIDQFQQNDYNHSEEILNTQTTKYSNPIARILFLFDLLINSPLKSLFIEQLIKHYHIEILGEYFTRLPLNFLDEQFLISLEQLIDTSRSIEFTSSLTNQFVEYILLDFSLWIKAIYHVRIIHLQYIFKLVKDEKKYDRDKFGVQFFLDILRQYFNLTKDDTDEQRQLRSIIYGIIKYIIQSHTRFKDFQILLSTISTLSPTNDQITFELINVIYSLVTNNESIIDLFSETNFLEGLYSLLILNNLLSETKEMILKLINILLQSKRLPQQIRSLLRLETNNIGFGGIISCLALHELNPSIVNEILNIITTSNLNLAVHHLNIVLTLCSAASPDVRYIAIRKLMKYFIDHPTTCCLYAKCSGWQETLAHFFVKTRRSSVAQMVPYRSSSQDHLADTLKNSANQSNRPLFDIVVNSEASLTNQHFHKSSSENLISNTNEMIITPPQSNGDSREDLLSFFKIDNSTENLSEQSSTSLTRTTTNPSLSSSADSRFFVRPSVDIDEEGVVEEMCETLILAIVMILWKGIVGSDDAAWMMRGQIFSAVRRLRREYDLYVPLDYIERRILELSMEICLNDAKQDKAKHSITFENNCRELIKLVHDFLSRSNESSERITDHFVNGLIPILDSMLIFKKAQDDYWTETSLTGFNILLILLGHSNTDYSSQASIRIHSYLNCRSLSGREEAAYLLSTVNKIFLSSTLNHQIDYQTYLFPLMKIILDKSSEYLPIEGTLGEKFLSKSLTDDFPECLALVQNNQWQEFINEITEPYADHYRSMSIRLFEMNMQIWWNNCQEMIHIAVHKRNRLIGVEKLKFQSSIVQPWQERRRNDNQRYSKIFEQRSIHQIQMKFQWKNESKYVFGECGPWFDRSREKEHHWILSDRENLHRMRCKLIENEFFNKHEESSRLRDNLHIEKTLENQNQNQIETDSFIRDNPSDEQDPLELTNEFRAYFVDEKEKILIASKCRLIGCASLIDGELIITDKYLYFFNLIRMKTCETDFKYPLVWLQDIYLRRYNLRPTALEFFLINQKNFLLNFDENFSKKTRRHIFYKLHSLKLPLMKTSLINLDRTLTPEEIFKESKIMDKWRMREISNFDYLMMLNTIAGRTYNDLNQYPIFPWIIKDYTSQVLDLKNPDSYRDFSKPIGIQNPKHIDEVKFKYESFDDPSGLIQKFHYGTHYSNAASVMHYLVRMEPFTTLHIQLQSGKFDIADRQFHSFESSWINIMDSPNDGKELIPEFFYLPEFLSNSNQFDLGKLQSTNQFLNDVQLPPWAHDSSEEFIRIHRLALESDYVSAHLHKWIDLIFGYKQKGQAAIDAFNVFMYCSYEDNVQSDTDDDDSVRKNAIDGMIQNFGQIPSQLLNEPHPQRQTKEQMILINEIQGKTLNIFQNLTHIKAFFVDVIPTQDKRSNPIIFLSIPKNQTRSFMQQGTPDTLVTVHSSGLVGNNGWHPYDKLSNNFFTFERDPTLILEKNRLTLFSPTIDPTSRLFALSHDGKYIFSGGHWDSSLRVYSLSKSKSIHSFIRHTDIITCLSLDSTGYILVTGSRDTTCIIWYLSSITDQDSSIFLQPERILYGHKSEITCLCVSSELDFIVTGSLDGTCNMYSIEQGIYLRTLYPTNENLHPIKNIKLSDERYFIVQTENDQTHLYLYSINGHLIRTRKFEYQIVDMILVDQYIIIGVNHQSTNEQSAVAARVIIKDLFEMTTIQTIRLRTQINCLHITKDLSHLLVPVKDGKLFVLTTDKKLPTKPSVSKTEKK